MAHKKIIVAALMFLIRLAYHQSKTGGMLACSRTTGCGRRGFMLPVCSLVVLDTC